MNAAVLVAALVLDAALGEPAWLWSRLPHPAVLMGRAVALADRLFNRGRWRRLAGAAAILGLAALAALVGLAIGRLPAAPVWEALAAAVLLAQRSLADHVAAVATSLRAGLAQGREAVARIVGRDTEGMTQAEAARAAIESAAENLSDAVVAPAFWFLVAGLPGMLVYKLVNTADSMIGHRTPRHEAFGWASARLDDLLNLIPARLTALLIWILPAARRCRPIPIASTEDLPPSPRRRGGRNTAASAFPLRSGERRGERPAPGYSRRAALATILRDAPRHRSPNAGWPEAAMAAALGVAISGPRSYHGQRRDYPFVNEAGRHDIGPAEIDAAVRLLWRTWALMLVSVVAVALVSTAV